MGGEDVVKEVKGAQPSSASCATSGPSIGWEDPLADQEDSGHDPWGAYGAFEEDDRAWALDDNCFRGDYRHSFLLVVFARLL